MRRARPCSPSTSAACATCQLARRQRIIDELRGLPDVDARRRSQCNDDVRRIAEQVLPRATTSSTWAGSIIFPVALEGALKLKEISYIHAEGYPAAEMKHGPIALVDENTPSVFLMPHGAGVRQGDEQPGRDQGPRRPGHRHRQRRRRGGRPTVGRRRDLRAATCRSTCSRSSPSIPLQLLAYHIAVLRGCDVDKPRNLAKSVTVE